MRGTILVREVHKSVRGCTRDVPWVREGVQVCARGVVCQLGKSEKLCKVCEKCHTGQGGCAWNVAWVRKSVQGCKVV